MTTKDFVYEILIEYANKVKDCDIIELIELMNEIPIQINERIDSNLISGEKLLVHNIMTIIMRDEPKYRRYPFYENKQWIFKEFHDYYFDYDGIKNNIIKCMDSFLENNKDEN